MTRLVEIRRLDNGPIQVGTQWKETRKMLGKEASEHFEVYELNKPDKIVLYCDGTKGSTGKGEYIYTYIIESDGNDSRVNLYGEIKGLTGVAKLFGKMMAGTFIKSMCKRFRCIKRILRKSVSKYFPFKEEIC